MAKEATNGPGDTGMIVKRTCLLLALAAFVVGYLVRMVVVPPPPEDPLHGPNWPCAVCEEQQRSAADMGAEIARLAMDAHNAQKISKDQLMEIFGLLGRCLTQDGNLAPPTPEHCGQVGSALQKAQQADWTGVIGDLGHGH